MCNRKVRIECHGSIILVRPLTERAKKWLHENVTEESTWFGDALAVEPRYLEGLLLGMKEEGLA